MAIREITNDAVSGTCLAGDHGSTDVGPIQNKINEMIVAINANEGAVGSELAGAGSVIDHDVSGLCEIVDMGKAHTNKDALGAIEITLDPGEESILNKKTTLVKIEATAINFRATGGNVIGDSAANGSLSNATAEVNVSVWIKWIGNNTYIWGYESGDGWTDEV